MDDKFPNTSFLYDHLETWKQEAPYIRFTISSEYNKKNNKAANSREYNTIGKWESLGAGKGVITRGIWNSSGAILILWLAPVIIIWGSEYIWKRWTLCRVVFWFVNDLRKPSLAGGLLTQWLWSLFFSLPFFSSCCLGCHIHFSHFKRLSISLFLVPILL